MRESNLVGQKFNRLLALEKVKKSGRCWYLCLCDCGNKKVIAGWRLKSGYTKSCGCLQREADPWRNRGKRLKKGLANARSVIHYYKRNAKRRNILFELTESECIDLLTQRCVYCGRQPFSIQTRKNSWGVFVHNGIDRVDNSKPYTLSNVVPCCKDCNAMKRSLSKEAFLHIITLIYKNLIGGK